MPYVDIVGVRGRNITYCLNQYLQTGKLSSNKDAKQQKKIIKLIFFKKNSRKNVLLYKTVSAAKLKNHPEGVQ